MTLRKVPAALALGLLAALAAHEALYGGGHQVGGAYHGIVAQAALAGFVGLLLFFGAVAWTGSRGVAEGSVLAVRLRERLPGIAPLLVSVALWYGAVEAAEPDHAGAAPIAVLGTIALVGWLVLRIARAAADLLAGAVIAILRISFTPRTPLWNRRPLSRPARRRTTWARRRFARPPPIATACA